MQWKQWTWTGMLIAAMAARPAAASTLDVEQQKALRVATFEVVYPKPLKDSLTYEKPLPLELIPFVERNDKYYSVGTAFAIGDNRYVSAAHVIMVGLKSQYGAPALRDASGKVYLIDQMLRFSMHEDFAMFSLKDDPKVQPLPLNLTPALNETVFAVGNALGEGIVVRDGLYTSDTPEEQDGRWKWIRFSAAASPGNSGGPLLDHQGHVIGVVLRKSANENLNYAVPISRVVEAKAAAAVDMRYSLKLPILQATDTMNMKDEFPLPRKFDDFDHELDAVLRKHGDADRAAYLAKHQDRLFPRGDGSQQLLNTLYYAGFPLLMQEKSDNHWDAFQPDSRPSSDLGHNGYVTAGYMQGMGFAELRRPDDVPADQFYGDSKVFMDLMVKGIGLTRRVGSDSVKITSLGKAATEAVYVDARGRKWELRSWNVEYSDSMVVTASLAVPSGYVVMYSTVLTKIAYTQLELMKVYADYVYVSFFGTLAQWREFRASKALQPAILPSIEIDFTYDKSLRYRSKRCAIEITKDLQKITPNSGLTLKFSFFEDGGKVVWDVASVSLSDDVNGDIWFTLLRNHHPPASLPDSYSAEWNKIVERRHPYTRTSYKDDGRTVIESTLGTPTPAADFLYTMSYYVGGEKDPEAMRTSLETLEKGTTILEH